MIFVFNVSFFTQCAQFITIINDNNNKNNNNNFIFFYVFEYILIIFCLTKILKHIHFFM